MGKKYVVESQFEDLHGNPDDSDLELDVDLSDSDNPIIKAALGGEDENWKPPAKDDVDDEEELENEDVDEDDDSEDDDADEEDGSDEEDDDEGEDDEDEEDDEDSKYSKKVQKRIERERRLRQDSEDAANRRIRKMEKKLELRDAKDDFRSEERKLERKLKDLRAKKREAIEEGNTDEQIDIDEEILDIKSEIRLGKAKLERLEKELENDDFDVNDGGGTPPAGQKWLQRYPEFHSNPRFRDAVLRADQMVAQQGLDKNTDVYYAKIEEIVNVTFPDIVKKRSVKVRTKKSKTKKKKRPAVSGSQRAGTRRTTTRKRKGVIRLTKADQANMRIFGMDPANPEHVKAYAESKE